MIKLIKGEIPQIIVDRGEEWATLWVDHVENGTKLRDVDTKRYKHPKIKEAILRETAQKCAYCESKVTHTHPGDIEHILPKLKRPDLFITWNNLTLSCDNCNTKKGQYYSEEEPLLNPYSDDPQKHLVFHGALVFHVPGSLIGERTLRKLDLSRVALVERRTDRIQALKPLIDRWFNQPEGALKALLLEEICKELSQDREYTAMLRSFAHEHAGIEV